MDIRAYFAELMRVHNNLRAQMMVKDASGYILPSDIADSISTTQGFKSAELIKMHEVFSEEPNPAPRSVGLHKLIEETEEHKIECTFGRLNVSKK